MYLFSMGNEQRTYMGADYMLADQKVIWKLNCHGCVKSTLINSKPCTSYQLTITATTAIKPTATNLTQPALLTPAIILTL